MPEHVKPIFVEQVMESIDRSQLTETDSFFDPGIDRQRRLSDESASDSESDFKACRYGLAGIRELIATITITSGPGR
jgi:hypothetical protein